MSTPSAFKNDANPHLGDEETQLEEANTRMYRIKLENDPEEKFREKHESQIDYSKPSNESTRRQIVIDNYKTDMVQNFYKFRNENLFTDVFIYVEGVEFPCHKVVLCAASCYFKAMFSCDLKESRLGKVFIENISPWTMKRLLDFIYTGKTEVNYENVIEIFNAAVMFQLNKLADKCSDYIHEHIDLANCIEIHVFSSMHQLDQLENDTFQFILDNFMQLINFQSMCINKKSPAPSINPDPTHETQQTSKASSAGHSARIPGANSDQQNVAYFGDFVRLNEQTFSNLIKSDSLNVSREIYVYYALKKWMDYRFLVGNNEFCQGLAPTDAQIRTYENLFRHIRLNALTPNELEYILYNDAMVSHSEALMEQIKYHLQNSVGSVMTSECGKKKTLLENCDHSKDTNDATISKLASTTISQSTDELPHTNFTNHFDEVKIRPSTIPRDYLCFLRANQFQYYDFYKSKWDVLHSWPPSHKPVEQQANTCCNFFTDLDVTKKRNHLSGYSTCLINNILFVLGGYLLNNTNEDIYNQSDADDRLNLNESQNIQLSDDVWRFDPIKNEWSNCRKMLRKRAFHISISLVPKVNHKLEATRSTPKLIFLLYGLCNDRTDQENTDHPSGFPLRQCTSIEFYNLETDQWSKLKNTDSLLNHHIFQSINNQNRLVFTGSVNNGSEQTSTDEQTESIMTLLNQLIEHQQMQEKQVISLYNLIYILKENCIHCYEFDLNLEQLICLPYFRLPANLSTFVFVGAVPSKAQPSSAKSLFTWYSNIENVNRDSIDSPSLPQNTNFSKNDNTNDKSDDTNSHDATDFNEVLIYLLNMQMGVLYQFYPAKNKLKKLPSLLLKHSSNETFIVDIKSKLYVTGGLMSEEEKSQKSVAVNPETASRQVTANAIEEYDEEKETWSLFISDIEAARVSPTTSAFSMEDTSDYQHQMTNNIKETRRFFKLKMALV